MPRLFSAQLALPPNLAAAGVGADTKVGDMQNKWVQVIGPFGGGLNLEISLDNGSNYWTVFTGLTAPNVVQVPQSATHMRVRSTSALSGTPKVVVAGFYDAG